MTGPIVQTSLNVTLIGSGPVKKAAFAEAMDMAPYLVAADGGAQMAQKYGASPKCVIGDLDSIDGAVLAQFPAEHVHHVAEQDTTDFDKCLRNISAPLILGLGFLGRRIDHQLAALSTLLAHADRRCILIGRRDVVMHTPPHIELELDADTRVSLFPLSRLRGRSSGLRWPIDGLDLAPGRRIGTSNLAVGGAVRIEPLEPGLLTILPRRCLASAARALLAAPVWASEAGRWA